MVWPWKKKNQIIDLSSMKASGLLERSKAIKFQQLKDSAGTIDFTSPSTSTPASQTNSGFLSFMDSQSNSVSSDSMSSMQSPLTSSSYNERLKEARRARLAEFKALQTKVEDLEYKLDRLIEKIDKLDEKSQA